jgi:hypothetical protein
MDKIKRSRVIRLVITIVGIIFVCPLIVHFGYRFGPSMWGNLHVVNFIVAWIPFILSVLVAFVPDKELEIHMRVFWRISVIVCGLLYSATLWHAQTLADIQSAKQINDAVDQAVSKANDHSDSKFAGVNQQVGTLGNKVEGVNQQQIALDKDFAKATGDINTNLGKVGKPEPPVPAKLVFSLWDTKAIHDQPTLTQTISPDKDGNIPVEFSIVNVSESTADTIDIWIGLCDKCAFAKEPSGFEKPSGSDERIRHRVLGSLNPGVSFEKMTILVKSSATGGFFQVELSYSCKNCGGKVVGPQIATVLLGSEQIATPQ